MTSYGDMPQGAEIKIAMVDLSGQRPQTQAQAGPSASGTKETTLATFAADVITPSAHTPVLVLFWSQRSEASKQALRSLETVVMAAAGKVKLVKMDIDSQAQIAARLGVRSAPAVIAFQRGQPADGYLGALPEPQIKGFIERLAGPIDDGTEEAVAAAGAALTASDFETAIDIFASILEQDPAHIAAASGLVRAFAASGDVESARGIFDQIPAAAHQDKAVIAAHAALDLAEQAGAIGDLAELQQRLGVNPDDHQARFDLAIALNGKGKRAEAADELLTIIKRDRTWNDDGARKQLLQFFDAWSLMDPVTASARRKLSGLLFS